MARFDENTRVKFPATIQFMRLGYDYQSLKDCEIDANTRIFKERFKTSIERINNVSLTEEEVTALISEIHELIKRKDMGKEFYRRIIQRFCPNACGLQQYLKQRFCCRGRTDFCPRRRRCFPP